MQDFWFSDQVLLKIFLLFRRKICLLTRENQTQIGMSGY